MKYLYGFFYKHGRIRKNQVLLESFHGRSIGDSSLVLAREIERMYPGKYQLYFATVSPDEHQKFVDACGLKVKLVEVNTARYARILATSKYIISNASLPIYFIRRQEQVYLQTWHGTPLKTLGKEMRLGIESMYNVQHNFLQASHITFPNDFTKNVIMRDYNLENLYTGKVVMSGYPRNRIFMIEGEAEKLREKLNLQDKKIYAYMPTWRGTSNRAVNNSDYLNGLKMILQKLDRALGDDQLFYINFHPILDGSLSFEEYRHIRAFPEDTDNYAFLNCADVLVTDYSSVFFDFSLTGKPVILFMYDYEQYMMERGMYMDIKELPFRQIFDVDEFCTCLRRNDALGDSYTDTEYYRSFFPYDRPDCSERLIRLLMEDDPQDLTICDYGKNLNREIRVYKPKNIKEESEFRTLAEAAADDGDVVLLYRKWFNRSISALLHDKYNWDFHYVITTDTPPRTYLEQVLSKLGSKTIINRIADRDMRRILPGLNVSERRITDYGSFGEGIQIAQKQILPVEGRVRVRKQSPVIGIEYEPLDASLTPLEAVILDNRSALVLRRPLEASEIRDRYLEYDLTEVIEGFSVYLRGSATLGIHCLDSEGRDLVVCFTEKEKQLKAEADYERDKEVHSSIYPPVRGEFMLPADYRKAKLNQILHSSDEAERKEIRTFNMERVPTEIFLLPHIEMKEEQRHVLKIRICNAQTIMNYASLPASLRKCDCRGNHMHIRACMDSWDPQDITGGMLYFDSYSEVIRIPMRVHASRTARGCMVDAEIDISSELPLKSLRWFCYITVKLGEYEFRQRIAADRRWHFSRLKLKTIHCTNDNDMLLIPYFGMRDTLKFIYRENSEYDNPGIRRRELLALIAFFPLFPILRSRRIYIIYEKFCRTAQDNSLYFFRYCMEQLPEKERKRFYYVIDKRSPDYQTIKEYDSQIIEFMSLKHMIYAMAAKLCISTDSISHLYVWQPRPSYVDDRIRGKGVLFLQHGVTALKRVDNLFGKKGSSPMKYFVTTSKIEQDIVIREFGYSPADVPIVGFTRWDVLQDKEDKKDRFILIMPTWRSWLEDVSDKEFTDSEYYKSYSALLQDVQIRELLETNDLKAVLYLHPKFAQYIDSFKDQYSDRIICIPFGQKPLNDLMMRCAMLVTDYSSVCWDVMYLKKPVVFYQFDYEQYQSIHGSYIDLRTQLPCPRTESRDEVIRLVNEYVKNDFKIQDQYVRVMDQFFEYRDSENSKRTYDYLMFREENKRS